MKTDVDSAVDRHNPKLNVLFINGTVIEAEKSDILGWLTERTTVALVGCATIVFLIYYAYFSQREYIPEEPWLIAALIISCVLGFFSIILAIAYVAFWVVRLHPNFILPIPLVVVVSHVIIQMLGVAIVEYWDVYVPDYALLYQRIIKIYIFVLLFEIGYSVYVLPHSGLYKEKMHARLTDSLSYRPAARPILEQDIPLSAKAPQDEPLVDVAEDAAADTLTLGDHAIRFDQIRRITAEQNYVRIETTAGTMLVRAKLSKTVAALGDGFGVQANRSCWLSFGMITGTKGLSNGRLALLLSNGETITVPRARRKLILAALGGVCI